MSNLLLVFTCLIAAFWRLILCLSVVYELALIFLLFQVGKNNLLLFVNLNLSYVYNVDYFN